MEVGHVASRYRKVANLRTYVDILAVITLKEPATQQ